MFRSPSCSERLPGCHNPRPTGKRILHVALLTLIVFALLAGPFDATAAPEPAPVVAAALNAELPIYNDAPVSGWYDYSWRLRLDRKCTNPVQSGKYSIAVDAWSWGAVSFWHAPFQADDYAYLEFSIHGGTVGWQLLWVFLSDQNGNELPYVVLNNSAYLPGGMPSAGAWKQVRIPIADLGATGKLITRVSIMERTGVNPPRFYLDNIRFFGPDVAPPRVDQVRTLDLNTIALTFNEAITGSIIPANFAISSSTDARYNPAKNPTSVKHVAETRTLYLTVPQTLQNAVTYSVRMNMIADLSGHPMLPNTTVSLQAKALEIAVETGNVVGSVPSTFLGSNIRANLSDLSSNGDLVNKTRVSQVKVLRFPGSALADQYHWKAHEPSQGGADTASETNTSEFIMFAKSLGIEPMLTVNFGSGSAAEAADWVRFVNVTNHWGVKYWEIGGQVYDCPSCWSQDPVAYMSGDATHDGFNQICQAMKVVDPSIQIGVVGGPSWGMHNNWGEMVLRNCSTCADFYAVHMYPFGPGYISYLDLLEAPLHSSDNWAETKRQIDTMFADFAPTLSLDRAATEYSSYTHLPESISVQAAHMLFLADTIGQALDNGFTYLNQREVLDAANASGGAYGLLLSNSGNYRQPSYYVYPVWAQFGDQRLGKRLNTDPGTAVSAYASKRSAIGEVVLILVNRAGVPLTASIALEGFPAVNHARRYTASADSLTSTSARYNGMDNPYLELSAIPAISLGQIPATFAYTLDAYSVTALIIGQGPGTTTINLPLVAGWNLISLPITPINTAIANVLSSVANQVDMVYAYDSATPGGVWKKFSTALPPALNTLGEITSGRGYWVRATANCAWSVEGTATTTTNIPLYTGWNLVGYPAQTTRPLTEALAGIAAKYDMVYTYDSTTPGGVWKKFSTTLPPALNTLNEFNSGWGYWIRVTENCTWTVNGP